MESLAKAAIELQQSEEKVNFVPDRFERTYLHWMENIRDLVYFKTTLVGTSNSCLVS